MRTTHIFLLLYTGALGIGSLCSAGQNETCATGAGLQREQCSDMSDPTQNFLTCAGVPAGPDADHILNLKGLIRAALDVYSFMRSSVTGVPVVDLSGGVSVNDDHVIKAWLDVKLTPLLSSISKNFLTCLSNRNLSCSAYQTVVKELSQHFSGLDPVKQKWIYSFFMYPFLSRNSSSGCVDPEEGTEDWLMKNFGAFSVVAQVRDFTSINVLFSGLEVLHLLSPEQKAELLLHPEVADLTNGSLSLVFQSLLSSLLSPEEPENIYEDISWPSDNNTTIYMTTVPSASPQDPFRQVMNSFMMAFRPVGSFVKEFVALTQEQNLSSMRSATLMQAVMNLTLAEIAAPFKQNSTRQQDLDLLTFDPTDVNDWFTHIVSPILRRFLPQDQMEIPSNLTAVFHKQFYIETGLEIGAQNDSEDICSVFLDDKTCVLTDLVEHVATILHCAGRSNLTLSEETLEMVLLHLSHHLNSLLQQLSMTNFSSQNSSFSDVLDLHADDTFTMSSLQDESFVRLWFHVKLKPLLSTLTSEYLTCLSHKQFSCETFQLLVSELSSSMLLMSEGGAEMVYKFFIFSFLSRQNDSGVCPVQSSSDWITLNLGRFSRFATMREIYQLNRDFNAMEALLVLSPRQLAELIVEDLPGLPEKSVIINQVFDLLLVSSEERGLLEMLEQLVLLADEIGLNCSSYQLIDQRLLDSLSLVSQNMTLPIQNIMIQLRETAPPGCFLPPAACISTPINESSICDGVNRNETLLSAGLMSVCNIPLQQYACSPLTGFTAEHLLELLMCQLSSSSSVSKEIWKLLFTKTNDVLDQTVFMFSSMVSDMSQPVRGVSVSNALDVIGELRLEQLSPDQWTDVAFISSLFGPSLRPFLPSASPVLLQCVSSKNLSCQTYQHILAEFSHQFPLMDVTERQKVLEFFILPFLSRNTSDAGCVLSANSEWLLKNFGPFAQFVSVRILLSINRFFDPLQTLVYLSSEQLLELMVEDLPGLPERDVLINAVFDHLLLSPEDRRLPEVLWLLSAFSGNALSCNAAQLIFTRLDNILRTSAADLEPVVWRSVYALSRAAPADCLLFSPVNECPITPYNESGVCSGVHSSAIQQHLNSVNTTQQLCDFSISEYACTPVLNVSVEQLVSVLDCNLMSSPESWKLFLTRVSHLLDSALHTLSNRSKWWSGRSASVLLDVLREIRLDRLSDDGAVVLWLNERLKPLLPFASETFMQCLRVKNISCQNFQRVVEVFAAGFLQMDEHQRGLTVTEFIIPFLFNHRSDAVCVSSNGSLWLVSNFGPFSAYVSLSQLISLNPQFNPLEALVYLSSQQLAELMVEDLPGLPEKDVLIKTVFDFLTASAQEQRIPDVLNFLAELSETRNISCVSYREIFHQLDHLIISTTVDLEVLILKSKAALLNRVTQGCVIYSRECDVTPANETTVCQSVNSSVLSGYLGSSHDGAQLCDFTITQYACAELSGLTAQDLASVLLCSVNRDESVSDETWKLFTLKINPVLGPALDKLNHTKLNTSRPSVSLLNMIGEVTLSTFTSTNMKDDSFIKRWFNGRLRPLLPAASETFLSCLSTRNFSCDTFRTVTESFSQSFDVMSTFTQQNIYVDFIKVFLSLNNTAGCVDGTQSSSDWLIKNFGRFSVFTSITDLKTLNPNFNVLDVLDLLSVKQLLEVASTPGLLSSAAQVNQLLLNVPDSQFTAFYSSLSAALQAQGVSLPPPVREEFLQQVFMRANLTQLSDAELDVWILNILPPFTLNITPQHVTAYFSSIQNRPCPLIQHALQLLNSSISTFQPLTLNQIYQHILITLREPTPLRCLGNQSYYSFLVSYFMSFQFPNLTTFLSLMPPARVPELMASMSPAEISSFLSRPNAVDDLTKICQLFTNYPKTPEYLQTEPLGSVDLARQVLACMWSQVLRMDVQSEVVQWFDYLVRYLPFLTPELISPDVMRDASCSFFQKFVSVMGKYDYSSSGFTQRDVYGTIQIFLNTSSAPKCYNASDPHLNSTAWFVNYIGVFMSFITLDDLLLFGSSQLQPFTINLENLQLIDQFSIPDNVTEFYATLLFLQDPSFSAYYLPLKLLCLAPASSFLRLSKEQVMIVGPRLHNCSNVQPDVSAALAINAGDLTAESIMALGQSCTALSTLQLSSAGGAVLLKALFVLSGVSGWNQDQAMAIVQALLSSGLYQVNTAANLQGLGSLIIGVPSTIINSMKGSAVITAVQSTAFISSILTAPTIIQQTIISQIISVNTVSDVLITNVPDVLATEIPRNFLLDMSSSSTVAQTLNKKKWKPEQAVLLFETVATLITDPDTISFQVLQGFTCTRISSFQQSQVMSLIRGCRRRSSETIRLQESQLTCMYSFIKNDLNDFNSFSQYPAEVLIYYNYGLINPSVCRSYFSALGTADFSVLSSTLSFKTQTLFTSARGCLGISGFNVSREQLDVLGNMCCFLNSDYIQNSDPYVLEKLKTCSSLSEQQISAIETLLLRGNTSYGPPATWNRVTLMNLGILPLYFTSNIWGQFTLTDKQKFQKTFIREQRKSESSEMEMKIMNMMQQSSKTSRTKRSTVSECTVGEITPVQIYSDLFPYDYDATQFNACLKAETLKYNLEAVTNKVYNREYQRIILNKLNQAYPDGLSDEVLQVLGSSSRAATSDDIRKWNVMKIDTLSALMNSKYGGWDPEMVQLIVNKYLDVKGNSLGTNELNSVGGANLCALNTSVLNNISSASVQKASALSLTNCSSEKKTILFSIAQNAFSSSNTRSTDTVSTTTYQLMQSYLGGADTTFVRKLVNSNVNMDLITFMNLEQRVINVLNVTDVRSLLGMNLADLKTYESNSKVQEWITLQLQSDLDTLRLGLTGGKNSSITVTSSPAANNTTSNSTTSSSTTTKAPSAQSSTAAGSNTATATTTGAAQRVWAPVCLQLFLLAVSMTTLQLLH